MKKTSLLLIAVSTLFTTAFAHAAGDYANGKKLQKNCFGCHDDKIYTRPNRIIHSYPDLKNRVKFCETNNGLDWSKQEIEDVATYLNKEFYKFPEE